MARWQDTAKEQMEGEYIKFDAGETKVLKFLAEPKASSFKSREDNKLVKMMDFPVRLYRFGSKEMLSAILAGAVDLETFEYEDKTLGVSSKRLMDQLIAEDDIETIIGRTFAVQALGKGFDRQWKLREIPRSKQRAFEDNWEPKEDIEAKERAKKIQEANVEDPLKTEFKQKVRAKVKKDKEKIAQATKDIEEDNETKEDDDN